MIFNPSPTSLYFYFSQIEDPRTLKGRRHSIALVLSLVTLAILSGCYSYRAMGQFIKRHHDLLIEQLVPAKKRLPTFFTIRRLLMSLDYKLLSNAFLQWASGSIPMSDIPTVAIDGKSLKGTLSNYKQSDQDFITLVSAYAVGDGRTVGALINNNKGASEAVVVRDLIKELGLKDAAFTLDALHCEKKL